MTEGFPSIASRLKRILTQQDLFFAAAMVILVAVLVLPMPAWLVDIGLATSITLSVLILMVALWIDKPVDFNAFPTVLLIATMLRLALNLATTRLILSDGHRGLDAAGSVINGFAVFVVGGDFMIGVIVFVILIVVNFVVITKGASRIAEVAARFNLDAMPGKQMAIDADLTAGLVTEEEAKKRRRELEDENSFYGAMDGASKFVRGDAIAAIIITLINILGGIIIGMVRHNLSLSQAATLYTTLTIGDGIVSQIPALIVSLGAGLLVSKGSVRGSTDRAFLKQLGGQAKPLFVASGLSGLFALLPGLPFFPFIVLSLATAGAGFLVHQSAEKAAEDARIKEENTSGASVASKEEPITDLIRVDELRVELGMGLVSLTQGREGGLSEKIRRLRRSFAIDYGFVLPAVRIKDNVDLSSGEYSIQLQGVEIARETMALGKVLAFAPGGQAIRLPGQDTFEPSFKLPARWIDPSLRSEAARQGITVVDIETVLTTHLSELIRSNMSQLLTYGATQRLLENTGPEHQKLVSDLVPSVVPLTTIQKVLSGLLSERISIRNMPLILEGIGEAAGFTRNVNLITEHVRGRLALQICRSLQGEDGYVAVILLSSEWEREIAEATVHDGDRRSYALPPSRTQALVQLLRDKVAQAATRNEWPAILTSTDARPLVRTLVERINPTIMVISHSEVHQRTKLRTIDQI